MFFFRPLHSLAALMILFSATLSSVATLPPDEVEALQQIATTLEKTDWNFKVDPCSGQSNWNNPNPIRGFEGAVTCNCSFNNNNNTMCHVVSIVLRGQNLSGTVPPELVRLPYLKVIDLSRNYLNGTIPPEWGSMKLENISLIGNRLSGTIPKELANISTLATLALEFNQLSGTIPPEIGNLPRIERILLTSNNLTGELPGTLAKLSTLRDFRIGDNQFEGRIPNFIQNWTNIEKLVIQGSGFEGPIPLGISLLTKLTDLRINNLNGNDSTFPLLGNAKNLKTLILRSCKIIGGLPDYLGSLTELKVLDLSFNQLSGQIPDSLSGLQRTDYIYLTGNFLTGPVPDWMLTSGNKINVNLGLTLISLKYIRGGLVQLCDISFNHLDVTSGSTGASSCQTRNLGILSCLRSFTCSQRWSSLHINCGGRQVVDDGTVYEYDDTESGGFFQSKTNWMVSNTGHFMDDDRYRDSYIWSNTSRIVGDNSQLYMDARVSPLSLSYYGLCMLNGNYTVNLHFAEIMFTDDKTYSSLGRRVFDVYIQGKLVLKDFNIKDEAGGVNNPIIKSFQAEVFDNTLEMHFYWAGKGTTGIPVRGVYGPLVSAISVESDSTLPSEDTENQKGLPASTVAGIVIAVIFFIFLFIFVLWWKNCLKCKDTMEQDLKGLDLRIGSFTLRQIKAATNNFNVANKIGEGGFGSVYKGKLSDGTIIAVKQLSSKSNQGNREFVNEIGMISALQHPNLVKLYGCCVEANQLLLVYEYMENNSLARALFGSEEHQLKLDWPTRHNICVGIAKGLAYLHEESRLRIVHRDIKATNVLLDKNLKPKVSDFGLAKLHEEENSHITTRVAGTLGYMAPEYAMSGYLTNKADVYSFGVVLLEIVSGKSNTSIKPMEDCFCVLDWARKLKKEDKLMDLVDSRLGSDFDLDAVMSSLNVALLCTNVSPAARPSMSIVVKMLEGQVDQKLISASVISTRDSMQELEEMFAVNLITDLDESQTTLMTTEAKDTTPLKSMSDLYPICENQNNREYSRFFSV